MSQVNGDKSRFNRVRKQKIRRRVRYRELLQAAATARAQTGSAERKSKDGSNE
jgi:hypothetical protein